jgi:hypothetical protein
MGMESTLKNSFMIAIFIVCVVTFAVSFAVDNDSDITISNDSRFEELTGTIKTDLGALANESTSSKDILLKTTLESGDEHAGGGGQFKVGPFTAIGMAFEGTKVGFASIFGGETERTSPFAFILIGFVSLFVFLIGYYVIKAWLGRDPS